MADYLTTDTELTSIASAIRTKGGTSSALVYPQGFIDAINNISSGGITITDAEDSHGGTVRTFDTQNATTIEPLSITANGTYSASAGHAYNPVTVEISGGSAADEILARTISGVYENSTVSMIGSYAFFGCDQLTTVSFPACSNVGENAFLNCTNLATANFTSCTSIGELAFMSCSNLLNVSFPMCEHIAYAVFSSCTKLTSADFSRCITIDRNAFYSCGSLTTANFPACTNIGSYAFARCIRLDTINFPVCTNIESYGFSGCSSLTSAYFPVCTHVGGYAFSSCYRLSVVSLPSCTSIENYAFYRCSKLLSLYLTWSSVATLTSSSAFFSTPIGGNTGQTSGVYGSIYVPASLLTEYQSAENWSYFSSRFVGI